MMNRFVLPIAAVGALAAAANAQILSPSSPKTLSTVAGWSVTSDTTLDVAVDPADGSRYVVGQTVSGVNTNGYVLKLTKKGFLTWSTPIDFGANEASKAVAIDAMGHVYVSTDHDGQSNLAQFDAATGAMNWNQDFGVPSQTNDIAVDSNGKIDTVGWVEQTAAGAQNPGVTQWTADGTNTRFYYWAEIGAFNSCKLNSSDDMYMVGFFMGSANSPGQGGIFGYVPHQWTTGTRYAYNPSTSTDTLKEVVIDPNSQMAFAVGTAVDDTDFDKEPMLATLKAIFNGTSISGTGYYGFIDYSDLGGAIGAAVSADPDGNLNVAVTGNADGGTTYADVHSFKKSPGDIWVNEKWMDSVPDVSETTNTAAYDLIAGPDGPILTTLSERVFGSGATAFAGYNQFTWTPDGARINRIVLGAKAQRVPASYDFTAFPNDTTSSSGDYIEVLAKIANGHTGLFTSQEIPGPDDSYQTDEDTTLTVGAAKGLLVNDGNQFDIDATLKASYLNGSASAGLASVTVNTNGTFTAVPAANFNGIATFQYKVKDGATVIATNTATITVKPKNDAPVAVDDAFNVAVNAATQNLDVLANDTDADGDALTLVSKTTDPNATIGITADKKFITFKPKHNYSGPVTFTYTCRDPSGAQSTATVTVTVS